MQPHHGLGGEAEPFSHDRDGHEVDALTGRREGRIGRGLSGGGDSSLGIRGRLRCPSIHIEDDVLRRLRVLKSAERIPDEGPALHHVTEREGPIRLLEHGEQLQRAGVDADDARFLGGRITWPDRAGYVMVGAQ
jgi:hypothetical protein